MIEAEKICFCISLKMGSIIIGLVILSYGCITASIDAWGFTGDEQMIEAIGSLFLDNVLDKEINLGNPGLIIDTLETNLTNGYEGIYKLEIKVGRRSVTSALLVSFIFGILEMFAASSLIFGAYKSKKVFVLPILILLPVDLLAKWISKIFLWNNGFGIIHEVIMTIFVGYMWVCVHSFWLQLKEESAAKENLENPGDQETPTNEEP
jgi:hypothetical protein